ncbi:MAG TPA: N-acetylmuramoyl-L-alanine amidase, partial [Coriobacteriia bacterium]
MSQQSHTTLPGARPRHVSRIRQPLRAFALGLALALVAPSFASGAPYVYVDPGHGGAFSNANRFGLKEKHINLWLGLELRRQLQLEGFDVGMTRTRDQAVNLQDIPTWQWSDALGWRHYADGRTR